MSLRKPNLHHVPREISQSERRLHCRNLFLVGNEKWGTVEPETHISSDRVRSGYEIRRIPQPRAGPYFRIQDGRGEVRARRVYLNVYSVTGNVVDTE